MFVVIAVFLGGLLFFVQQALLTYSLIEISSPYQTKEHYIVMNVMDAINQTINTSSGCLAFENDLKELLSELREDFASEGYLMNINYDLNCSNWDSSTDAPLSISLSFPGIHDVTGMFKFYNK